MSLDAATQLRELYYDLPNPRLPLRFPLSPPRKRLDRRPRARAAKGGKAHEDHGLPTRTGARIEGDGGMTFDQAIHQATQLGFTKAQMYQNLADNEANAFNSLFINIRQRHNLRHGEWSRSRIRADLVRIRTIKIWRNCLA
jgi:hypothetical protein